MGKGSDQLVWKTLWNDHEIAIQLNITVIIIMMAT